MNRRSIVGVLAAILVCQSAGLIGIAAVGRQRVPDWYRQLHKPGYAPPSWVYGPVWTLLYTLMGVSLHRLWRRRHTAGVRPALVLFAVQLLLNAAWTPVFFGVRSIQGGLMVIIPMLAAILGTLAASVRVDRKAAALLLPYALWTSFATGLNASLLRLNPAPAAPCWTPPSLPAKHARGQPREASSLMSPIPRTAISGRTTPT